MQKKSLETQFPLEKPPSTFVSSSNNVKEMENIQF